jgi:hypothetical protein
MKDFTRRLDEIQRREFLAGVASLSLGVTILPSLINAETAPGGHVKPKNPKAKNVIFVYMDGGMSHLDTFDPKTNSEVKGISNPIKTNAPGLQISKLLPNIAKHGDKLAVLRTMAQKTGAHAQGKYLMHTSYAQRPGTSHPHLGSWAQYFLGRRNKTMPDSVLIGAGNPGPGFFPPDHAPFPLGDAAKGIRDLLPKIDKNVFSHRVQLAQKFSRVFEHHFPHDDVKAYAQFYDETVKFFDNKTVAAFDINKEPAKVRDLYGRSKFGNGLLLARRLIEHKVRYVEVKLGGWDGMHNGMAAGEQRTGELDAPFAALLEDLQQRGLLKETMIVLTTEFGRTPKINQRGGRDHFPGAFSAVLAGGGVNGGQAIGETDEKGIKRAKGDKIGPADLHATIADALGLPLDERIHGSGGRPFFVGNRGKVIEQAFA